MNLGSLQARKNQWAEAANNFRKAVAYKDNYTVAYNDLAYVLRKQGKLGEAITAAKRAIELKPDYAEAHLTMGLALSQRGEFDAALTALKRGHELGVKTPGWSMPSAELVAQCETFVALNEKLPRVVKGEAEPKNTRELVQLAQFAHGQKQLYGAAAQLWERLAKDNPRLRVDGQDQRYNAARAAALIGCGRGEDASAFDEKERARWRRQALEWLRADLEEWTRLTDSGPSATVPALQRELQHWQEDDDLVGLRGPSHVSDLPTDERETCRKLWADVRTLLARNKQ